MFHPRRILSVLALGAIGLAGCSQQQTASDEPRIVEQTVALKPASVSVKIGPLSGELSNVSVMRRVEETTGNVVYPPQLTGTLVLRNTSQDLAVRVIGGELTYLGPDGTLIRPAGDREDTAFTLPSYSAERLDPGDEMRHTLDVPFPAGAFEGGLGELRLGIDYLSMPYHEGTVTVGMSAESRS